MERNKETSTLHLQGKSDIENQKVHAKNKAFFFSVCCYTNKVVHTFFIRGSVPQLSEANFNVHIPPIRKRRGAPRGTPGSQLNHACQNYAGVEELCGVHHLMFLFSCGSVELPCTRGRFPCKVPDDLRAKDRIFQNFTKG